MRLSTVKVLKLLIVNVVLRLAPLESVVTSGAMYLIVLEKVHGLGSVHFPLINETTITI